MANDLKERVHAECMRVLDDFMAALNAYDAGAMDREMHFPHVRIAGGAVTVYERPGGNPLEFFEKLKREDDWKWSRWEARELVQFNARKAHYAVTYTRFRSDDSVIGVYESLYVLTKDASGWGIQARSSFGP